MTIGEALKQTRKSMKLSQTEMAGDVLSTSYYSKIERGLNDIQTQDLIDLLKQHGLQASIFLERIENEDSENDLAHKNLIWQKQLEDAYYHQQIERLEDLKIEIGKYKNQSQNIFNLYALVVFSIASLKKQIDQISENIKRQVRQIVFDSDECSESTLQIFAMTMMIYAPEDMDFLINSIFRTYRHNVSNLSGQLQEIMSAIAINYLANVYVQRRKIDLNLIYDFISKLPEIPRNAFAKIVANYYHYCFDGKNEEADQIIEFMKSNGMSHLIKNFIVENCHL
ncbi:helix-turn-helix domain-containing protein [Lactobacillus crispatus]|jgi:XRE family transcriptional regulator|uniref:helix-turn-helix domain-containing protein n=1 Tax=Lactobacillus crispatus TaxID=47770 RepID=UPI000F5122FB|nr:helix-turn-helix transcriptional regulator [Lactobacillus crispatus]MCT7721695.1 helix-turn-helix transcriptional regulator [Lactobacillus crispatus]MCZ3847484.1 helix-turn-helix transcriptional regulator [Lactobacillus crispatus]MCZ3849746.1 helix-turn-helix transcriptional regulator [Lactobacillus crispatus]MCZ3855691.1 helix-turn-helix transcriptional regulator [Lactobacillus crispatus]MCZ3857937.1 helix-turn-helix transcriptional regulator [Lactobacillus crispatus]